VYLRLLDFSFVIVFHVFHAGSPFIRYCEKLLKSIFKIILFYSVVIQFYLPFERTFQSLLRLIHLIFSIRYIGTKAVLRFSEVWLCTWPVLSLLFAGILIFSISSNFSFIRAPYLSPYRLNLTHRFTAYRIPASVCIHLCLYSLSALSSQTASRLGFSFALQVQRHRSLLGNLKHCA
jgi:hypothetical protein